MFTDKMGRGEAESVTFITSCFLSRKRENWFNVTLVKMATHRLCPKHTRDVAVIDLLIVRPDQLELQNALRVNGCFRSRGYWLTWRLRNVRAVLS